MRGKTAGRLSVGFLLLGASYAAAAGCVGDEPSIVSRADAGEDAGATSDGPAPSDTGGSDGADGFADAGPDSGITAMQSCSGTGVGVSDCGSSAENCCTSLRVTGGTFKRSFDGADFNDGQFTATVSDFKLDKYEVTVGRFRKFVNAWIGGFRPGSGAGKHTHLSGGGLNAGGESGWDTSYANNLASTASGWDTNLGTAGVYATWTGGNDAKPINGVNWFEAYAFCIWDGGFLASEAEWNYAASGGSDQRVYPWGNITPGAGTSYAVYGCYLNGTNNVCTGVTNIAAVGSINAGAGKYGQLDMAGNMFEWTLDWYQTPYNPTSCADCASLAPTTDRALRGGSFYIGGQYVLASYRLSNAPANRNYIYGVRCARP